MEMITHVPEEATAKFKSSNRADEVLDHEDIQLITERENYPLDSDIMEGDISTNNTKYLSQPKKQISTENSHDTKTIDTGEVS